MKSLPPLLQKSRHGIYYLQIQRNGADRRISLGTRDPNEAAIAASIAHAAISRMKIDPDKIKNWTAKIDGDSIEITTEDSTEDRASAKEAIVAFVQAKKLSLAQQLEQRVRDEQPKTTMPMRAMIAIQSVS